MSLLNNYAIASNFDSLQEFGIDLVKINARSNFSKRQSFPPLHSISTNLSICNEDMQIFETVVEIFRPYRPYGKFGNLVDAINSLLTQTLKTTTIHK